jgi:hypothetical protein
MPDHPQVAVDHAGETVSVDEGMVDLLRMLWSQGAATVFSCQGGEDVRASVSFLDGCSLERAVETLADILAEAGEQQALRRLQQRSGEPGAWTIRAWPRLWFLGPDRTPPAGEPDGTLYYRLEFPAADRVLLAGILAGRGGVAPA